MQQSQHAPKHTIVTGASGGIGAACVRALQEQGHLVTEWDLPELDVTNSNQVYEALTAAIEDKGQVTGLIHCAGILEADAALNPNLEALQRSINVNFFGTAIVCSAVARHMAEQQAEQQSNNLAIVAITSNAHSTPRKGMAAYGASKAAAQSWMRTLALEVAEQGIRCNTVSPGSTETPMLAGMFEGDQAAQQAAFDKVVAGTPEDFRLGIPLGRVGSPDAVAGACVFLLSDAARHITMHDLRVDGAATFDA